MKLTTKENIKTDNDLRVYGWEMRILQIEEDIFRLERKRDEMCTLLEGLKEEDK